MICDTCQELEAKFMVGNMETGDQLAVCPPCAGRWGITMAKIMLPGEEVAEMLGPMFVKPPTEAAEAPAEAPKSDKRPRKAAKRAAGPETPETLAEPAAAAEDA